MGIWPRMSPPAEGGTAPTCQAAHMQRTSACIIADEYLIVGQGTGRICCVCEQHITEDQTEYDISDLRSPVDRLAFTPPVTWHGSANARRDSLRNSRASRLLQIAARAAKTRPSLTKSRPTAALPGPQPNGGRIGRGSKSPGEITGS